MPLGGSLSDWLERKLGSRLGRKGVPIAGMVFSATFLVLGIMTKSPFWIVTFFTISLGSLGTAEGPFWQTAVQLGGRHGGTAAALINTGGNGVGLLAPFLTPAISESLGWAWGISFGALVSLIGALCWCWIDIPENSLETKPVDVPPGP
jgi:MFS family permease